MAAIAFVAIVGASYLHLAAMAGAGLAALAVFRKQWITCVIASLGMLLALLPLGAALSAERAPASEADLTVYSANLLYGRARLDEVASEVRMRNVDVILLQESTPKSERRIIELLGGEYPYIVQAARDGAFGQTTLSRFPFTRPAVIYPPTSLEPIGPRIPQIGCWVRVPLGDSQSAEIEIWNVHTLPPLGFSHVIDQDRLSRGFVELAGVSVADAMILAGDFNCPEAGPVVQRLLRVGFESAHLADGAFTGWTWPAGKLLLMRTRIDQILSRNGTRAQLRLKTQSRGQQNGSDHLPVWASYDIVKLR